MEIKHNTKNMLRYPLPDLLEKFYSAAVLKQFAELTLYPLFPDLRSMEKPRKADLIGAILSLGKDRKKLKELISSFSPELFKTIETLLWRGWMGLEELEELLGFPISRKHPNYNRLRYGDLPFQLLPGFELIALGEVDGYYYYGRNLNSDPQKARYQVVLPPAMVRLLKPGFPKPKHYDWVPVTFKQELPSEAAQYSAESTIAEDLSLVGDYLRRGNLKLTKAGKLTAASLRSIRELTTGGEFFPDSKHSKKLPALRHTLLLQSILNVDDSLVKLLAEEPFPARKVFRKLVPELLHNKGIVQELLLPHVKPSSPHFEGKTSPAALEQLRELFSTLPEGQWVTSGNLIQLPFYRDYDLLFLDPYYHRFRPGPDSPGRRSGRYYGNAIDLENDLVPEVLQVPLLLGTAFLLAVFGILEVTYVPPPEHPRWRLPGESFLSPFDGLIALKLTSLGAYAFGQTRQLSIEVPEKRAARVHLHPERLLATCKDGDPLTLAAMDEFMEKLAPGLYRLTPDKLLAGCQSKADLSERIKAFRKRIPAEVPEFWAAAFRHYLEAPPPLEREMSYEIFRIPGSSDLRQLFATDPVLRKIGLKVEGWRIAATEGDLKRIRERLASLGYLLESGSSGIGKSVGKKQVPRKKPRKRRWY